MKFLIVSDIHAVSEDLIDLPSGTGYFGPLGSDFIIENRTVYKNRIMALKTCLQEYCGEIDALLCLGDFAHQSKKLVMLQVWNDLHHVAKHLNIDNVIGITGNHDIASRVEDVEQAETRTDFLKLISPTFPSKNSIFNNEYNLHGIGAMELGDCLLLAFDTCRLHGLGMDDAVSQKIWSIGNLSDDMIQRALNKINSSSLEHIFLIMHHHPIKVDEVADQEYDNMKLGPLLLEKLGESGKNCVLVHGHKHMVDLKFSPVGSRPAIILSAASLAAYPYQGQGTHYSNQFHILEFDTDIKNHPDIKVLSWDWGASKWEKSKKYSMPHTRKLGKPTNLEQIFQRLKDINITTSILKKDLLAEIPEIDYLSNYDIDELNRRLDSCGRKIAHSQSEIVALIFEGDH